MQDNAVHTILIVDDDLAFAEALADILTPRGYEVQVADTPERALAASRRADGLAPGVALIDVRLGGVTSGVDLIPRLHVGRPELICVLMTVDLDTETAVTALRRGAYDYFDKSCDLSSLFAVLDRCFEKLHLQREREAAHDALRRAKEEAEAANRAKSGFLATMSHELRTPLNAIIGFSEMMLREVLGQLGNEQYRAYVANIHESGSHLLQIINDILDLSKAESGKLELNEDVFDMRDVLRSVGQLTGNRVRTGGLIETVELAPDIPLLRADERKTKQVLLNLITNAVKFTPPGGSVTTVIRRDPEKGLVIIVSDTGIGIAAEDLGRVLEAFEQVDSSLSRQHQGTGLGLPLVKAIMELHGGRLELKSTLGEGTQATAIFPHARLVYDLNRASPRNAA